MRAGRADFAGVAKVLVVALDSGLPLCSHTIPGADLASDDDLRLASMLFTSYQVRLNAGVDDENKESAVEFLEQGEQSIFSTCVKDIPQKLLIASVCWNVSLYLGQLLVLKLKDSVRCAVLQQQPLDAKALRRIVTGALSEVLQDLSLDITESVLPSWGEVLLLMTQVPADSLTPYCAALPSASPPPPPPSPKPAPSEHSRGGGGFFSCFGSNSVAVAPDSSPLTPASTLVVLKPVALEPGARLCMFLPSWALANKRAVELFKTLYSLCPEECGSPLTELRVQLFGFDAKGTSVVLPHATVGGAGATPARTQPTAVGPDGYRFHHFVSAHGVTVIFGGDQQDDPVALGEEAAQRLERFLLWSYVCLTQGAFNEDSITVLGG